MSARSDVRSPGRGRQVTPSRKHLLCLAHSLTTNESILPSQEGNAGGSYLTMRSKGGIIFGVINLIGTQLSSVDSARASFGCDVIRR